MKIDIHQALIHDVALIANLSRQTFYDTYAVYNTKENMDKFISEQFSNETLMKEIESKENIFLVAFIDGEAVGYVKMREGEKLKELQGKPSIEIARIYAATKLIGKGIGSALMQKSIDRAIEMNREIIWLAVWEKNQPAIDFYHRWGFEKFGDIPFILGNDVQNDWLMKKEIGPNHKLLN